MSIDMDVSNRKIVKKYKDVAKRMLHLSFPSLLNNELDDALNYSINKRIKNSPGKIYNNYSDKSVELTALDICDYILERKPILTSYGVLFTRKGERPNPIAKLLQGFMEGRDKHKATMYTFPKGSEDFEKYNLLQQLDKIDCNGFYGSCGMYTCILYNLHVAPSVTTTGRSCISTAGLLIESFLSNNVKFGSLNEIITFIDNIVHNEKRNYNDSQVLDRNRRKDEVLAQLVSTCGFHYIPTKKDVYIIWDIIGNLKQEDLNRIYYKNNLYEFMNNKSMSKALVYILEKLDEPMVSPNPGKDNEPMEKVLVEVDELKDLLMEYVYYPHQIIDRLDRYRTMPRKSCIITDTDSTICSFDAWYRFALEKVKGLDLKISHEKISMFHYLKKDEFGDIVESIPMFDYVDNSDYDFYDDEVIETEKSLAPTTIIPQEGVKHSIINIMAYCLGKIINDYVVRYTMNSNSYEKGVKCLLYMKNEFLFRRILLTGVMKNYASIQELQEGHVIPSEMDKCLDVKGLPMIKSTANAKTQQKLQEILYEDILNSPEIDQVKILKALAKFEKEIYESLNKGDKDFYTPTTIKSLHSYDDPLRKYGIKQAIIWNTIRGEQSPIDMEERNSVDIVKLDIDSKNVYKLKNTNEEAYNKITELMKEKGFEKIKGLAIPADGKIPDYLVEFIDFTSIINDNLSLFPVESIGIERFNKTNNYTNIIHI